MSSLSPPKRVVIGELGLPGDLSLPAKPRALIVVVHDPVSHRRSPLTEALAAHLQDADFAYLRMDLLTREERLQDDAATDIALLANRVGDALDWVVRRPALAVLPLGLLAVGAGAAAALSACVHRRDSVLGLVALQGRPDWVESILPQVRVPSLFIVGGLEADIVALNRRARQRMRSQCDISVVPGASAQFDEAGAMARVQLAALEWFGSHLVRR